MPKTVTLTNDSKALKTSAIAGLAATIFSFLLFMGYEVIPFAKGFSMVWVILTGSAIVALISFLYAFLNTPQKFIKANKLDTTVLAIAYTLFTSYLVFLLLLALAFSFKGLSFDPYTASWLVGISLAVIWYVVYLQGSNLDSTKILALLSVTMLGGVIASMVSSVDPLWWQHNFSTLGMYGGTKSSFAFNFTLIVVGVVISILAKYLLSPFDNRQIATWVRRPLIAMGLSLSAVGLFAYDPAPIRALLHNGSAGLIVISFILLIYGVHKTLPQLSQEFMLFSYGCIAATLASFIFFTRIGYFSLTASELAIFTIIFAWIIVFARNVQEISSKSPS